ncbi:MAG: glycosyltransferase family 4 protein [Planctomycetes bacterium]|nr:glycosyltransferase family 4 protein [Planctomycetota bacterium]
MLRHALHAQHEEVELCRLPGPGSRKRGLLRAPWRWPAWALSEWLRRHWLRRIFRMCVEHAKPRVIVVPYPGHTMVGEIKRLARVPVVLDLFLSAYDTAVLDRGLHREGSVIARLLRRLDTKACQAADLVLLDTPEHADHVAALTGVTRERFDWLPIGDPAAPRTIAPWPAGPGPLRLLFFGTDVPLHGLPVLLDAVAACPEVHLTLVGGSAAERARAQSRFGDRLDLQPEFVPRERLQELLDRAQLVAGVFGSGGKAQRVVPYKVVHGWASGRPVLTADTPAVRRVEPAGTATFFVPAAEPTKLAQRLRELAAEPARLQEAAGNARAVYDRHFSLDCVRQRFAEVLTGVCARSS